MSTKVRLRAGMEVDVLVQADAGEPCDFEEEVQKAFDRMSVEEKLQALRLTGYDILEADGGTRRLLNDILYTLGWLVVQDDSALDLAEPYLRAAHEDLLNGRSAVESYEEE